MTTQICSKSMKASCQFYILDNNKIKSISVMTLFFKAQTSYESHAKTILFTFKMLFKLVLFLNVKIALAVVEIQCAYIQQRPAVN